MWNGMGSMGNGGMMGTGDYASSSPSFMWMIPVGLIAIATVGVVGVGFYAVLPEIRPSTGTHGTGRTDALLADSEGKHAYNQPSPSVPQNPIESVSKTLTAEERKVLDVLVAHQGRFLQKYIRKEAGLSRLKTHRIIARFAERGIVTLKPSGNTNEISLADWLNRDTKQNPA